MERLHAWTDRLERYLPFLPREQQFVVARAHILMVARGGSRDAAPWIDHWRRWIRTHCAEQLERQNLIWRMVGHVPARLVLATRDLKRALRRTSRA